MLKKRASALLIAAALMPAGLAHALGLGEIRLSSALDQPLRAEIELRGVGDLSADEIRVRLASGTEFERAGVERLYSLTELRFAVDLREDGGGVVRISTEQPVREPYLDFLVEVKWPNGRVLREYTLLLDLPTYTPAPPPVVQAPVSRAPARPSVSPRSDGGGAWSGGDRYQVVSGDTLWRIASRTRPAGTSVQDMMEALYRGSPEAFIGGDINRLRAGAVLRVPLDAGEIASLAGSAGSPGVSETSAPVARQETTPQPSSPSQPASTAESDYLRLAGEKAATAGSAAGGETAEGGTGSVIEDRLAATEETLSAKERENAELQARVKALEGQVQDFQRLIDLKGQPAASPPAAPAESAAPGLLDWILGNALVIGAGLLAVAGAVLALVLRRRKEAHAPVEMPELEPRYQSRKKEPELAPEPPRAPPPPPPTAVAPPAPAAPPPPAPEAPPATPVSDRELADPLSEADIYIAYGRLERAVEVLTRALARDPNEHDLRLKLMEIHVEQDDGEGFAEQYRQLLAIGDPEPLDAARQIAVESGNAHWLGGSSGGPADAGPAAVTAAAASVVVAAAAPLIADPLGTGDAPELARFDVEADTGLDLDLDLGADEQPDAADHDGALDLEDLELGELGELELGAQESVAPVSAPVGELAPLELEDAAPAAAVAAAEEQADLDLLAGSDEVETRLELARAFIDMGDVDGARDILEEVMSEGSSVQRDEAARMLDALRPA